MKSDIPLIIQKTAMLFFVFCLMNFYLNAQTPDVEPVEKTQKFKKNKGKSVKYNGFGVGALPFTDKMIGGNHIAYRKFGFGLSWRFGIRNYERSKEGISDITYENAKNNAWLTGTSLNTYSYSVTANFVIAITKKIPFYIGAGITKKNQYVELIPYGNPAFPNEWAINSTEEKIVPTFTAGVFIPILSRIVLNIGYDYLPQTVFVGLAISGPFNYEDTDLW